MKVEWPPGSGVVGEYGDEELRLMRALLRQREQGLITRDEFEGQVETIHALIALDARLVGES